MLFRRNNFRYLKKGVNSAHIYNFAEYAKKGCASKELRPNFLSLRVRRYRYYNRWYWGYRESVDQPLDAIQDNLIILCYKNSCFWFFCKCSGVYFLRGKNKIARPGVLCFSTAKNCELNCQQCSAHICHLTSLTPYPFTKYNVIIYHTALLYVLLSQ